MRADGLVDVVDPQPHVTLWDAVYRAQEACPEDAIVVEED
jgi:ferredoxin